MDIPPDELDLTHPLIQPVSHRWTFKLFVFSNYRNIAVGLLENESGHIETCILVKQISKGRLSWPMAIHIFNFNGCVQVTFLMGCSDSYFSTSSARTGQCQGITYRFLQI